MAQVLRAYYPSPVQAQARKVSFMYFDRLTTSAFPSMPACTCMRQSVGRSVERKNGGEGGGHLALGPVTFDIGLLEQFLHGDLRPSRAMHVALHELIIAGESLQAVAPQCETCAVPQACHVHRVSVEAAAVYPLQRDIQSSASVTVQQRWWYE